MKQTLTHMPAFKGIYTKADASQLPLGFARTCKNMAQFIPGRLRRIAGLTPLGVAPVDVSVQAPIMLEVTFDGGVTRYTLGVLIGPALTVLGNFTSFSVVGGPALTGSFGQPWSHTFYNNKYLLAGNGNTIREITSPTTQIALTGTNVPVGNLIQSFLNKLYVADITGESGLVRFTDTLTTNFVSTNIVNVLEIPGRITALAVNSKSTDAEGIETELIISKKNALWAYDETRKDVVSSVVGSSSPRAWSNTSAGLIFLGQNKNTNSVFMMPIGTAGEPKDIGEALDGILNGDNPLVNPELAHAVFHDGFYKLFFSRTTLDDQRQELWLDTDELARSGEALWYGPHSRGRIGSALVTADRLEMVRRGTAGSVFWFHGNDSLGTDFTDMDGNVLETELDIPLTVEPANEEKVFDLLELQIAKEANTAGNQITYEPIAEGTSVGVQAKSIYDGKSAGISRVAIPIRAAGRTGMVARDARVIIRHNLNTRFDILGASVQYLRHPEGEDRVRTKH